MGHHFEPLTHAVIGAAVAVHRALGPGYLESTYHSALRIALEHRDIRFDSDYQCYVFFEGRVVSKFRLDLLVADQVVVELKAVESLSPVHFAQVRAYLRATGRRLGLLMNFNAPTLAVRRIVLDP